MTITSSLVATYSYIHNACDLRSLTCMGNKRHLVRMDDNPHAGPPGTFTQRYALSTDDGLTFQEQPEYVSTFLPLGPVLPLSFNTLVAGFGAGHAGDPYSSFALIGRSTDGGATWTSAVPVDLYSTLDPDNSDIYFLVSLGGVPAEVMAFGGVSQAGGGSRYHVLRSTNGGVSFSLFSQMGDIPPSSLSLVDAACYAGNNVLLASGDFLGGSFPPVSIWRSINRGVTWTEVGLPSTGGFGSVAFFCSMGGGVVLAGGQCETAANDQHVEAVVWRSTDFGATWTASVLPGQPFSGGGGFQRYTVTWLQKLTSSKVVAGITIFGPPPSVKHWRLSSDGGASFPDSGVETSPLVGTAGVVRQMTGADDGAILTAINRSDAPHFAEIWRSTVDGFTGPGPCAGTFQGGGTAETGPCSTPFRSREGFCIDTLNDDDIIRGRWQAGDRLIINRVIFSIDWDYLTQQFTKHVVYTFGDSVHKYGLRPAMRIESKGIRSTPTVCGNGATVIGCGLAMLDERAFALGARFADPPPMLNLEIFYRKHTWEPGDIICVTSAFVPNTIAGRRGIDNEAYEIINIQQQFAPEGKVILTLLDVEAITLPTPPVRLVVEDDQDLQALLREQQVYMTELPLRLEEVRARRKNTALFKRGKTQEGTALAPAAVPRREVFAGVGRGTMPRVP